MRDCTLVAVATGRRAQNLKELRDNIATVHSDSIYFHFWGGLLRPRFDDPEFNNDFAAWARDGLHEGELSECLGIIDPTDFPDLEALRQELIDVIESHLDNDEYIPWAKSDRQFHFIQSKIVVFDTRQKLEKPEMLPHATGSMSASSIFYHFIDARRRTPDRIDDFSTWLRGYGDRYRQLCVQLSAIDPYFATLTELREKITCLFLSYFGEKSEKLPA